MEEVEDIRLVHVRPVIRDKSLKQYKSQLETTVAWKDGIISNSLNNLDHIYFILKCYDTFRSANQAERGGASE